MRSDQISLDVKQYCVQYKPQDAQHILWQPLQQWTQLDNTVEMKKQRKIVVDAKHTEPNAKTRKQLRKQKKVQKKQRKKFYFQNKFHCGQPIDQQIINRNPISQPKINTAKITNSQVKTDKNVKRSTARSLADSEDDKIIKLYEQKLGIAKGKDKYKKIGKQFGMDDDIFDFLNSITNKTPNDHKYPVKSQTQSAFIQPEQSGEQQQIQQSNSQPNIEEELAQAFDQEYEEMFDNLDQFQQRESQLQQNQQQQQQQLEQQQIVSQQYEQPIQQNSPLHPQKHTKRHKSLFSRDQTATPQQQQIRKSMNSLFNKLSDGNILPSFRQFVRIIQSYPRSSTMPIYSQLFVRFNFMIQKPLFHITATNVALISALHYAFGNRLLGPALHSLSEKFLSLAGEQDDEQQVSEIGYSKRFQRMKNYTTIISLLYNYGSISGEFIESLVQWLTKSLNKYNIELLYVIIQKCGVKVRQNDPSILKNIISIVKQEIQVYKQSHQSDSEEIQKINFIELQLTEIKFNKKSQLNSDQRMAFLETFISKNVPKEIEAEKEVFPLSFSELITVDTTFTNWWNGQENPAQQDLNTPGDTKEQNMLQLTQQKQELLQLAKSFHMVTQAKKNIFICLMDSKDYLEATQSILSLKIKNYQDVATVLVEVCTLEPNFNPYYPLVAAKIASLMPKFRLHLQYSIWDHLKLLPQYDLRKTSNLAKFLAKLISDPLSNCSLSILKFYPDLSNIRTIDTTFLKIMLTHFFKKVKREYLGKLVGKLREQNNRHVKEGIKQLLSQIEFQETIKEKVRFCRRLLSIELDQRKAEQGDLLP